MTKKQELPLSVVGTYICAGIMAVLLVLSIVGIFIGGEDGTRPFFIMTAIILLALVLALLLVAKWAKEKAASRSKKTFASYAFEGEFAPQKNTKKQIQADSEKKTKNGH